MRGKENHLTWRWSDHNFSIIKVTTPCATPPLTDDRHITQEDRTRRAEGQREGGRGGGEGGREGGPREWKEDKNLKQMVRA